MTDPVQARAVGRPWAGLALWTLAGLLLGGLAHLAMLVALPALADGTGLERLGALAGTGAFRPVSPTPALPWADPALRLAACRYDLRAGPYRLHVPLASGLGFVSVSFYGPDGLGYEALTGSAAVDGAIDAVLHTPAQSAVRSAAPAALQGGAGQSGTLHVVAPASKGLVVLRALVAAPNQEGAATATLAAATCGPAP